MAKSLKAKAQGRQPMATGANWQTSAPPIKATAGEAPPIAADSPPKYKSAYAGMDEGGMGEMRHTTFRGRH